MLASLSLALVMAASPPTTSVQRGHPDDANLGAALGGAAIGAATGAALGVGASFAVVYGSIDGGCYVGGCDAPILSAVGFSVFAAPLGAVVGGVAGALVGARLAE